MGVVGANLGCNCFLEIRSKKSQESICVPSLVKIEHREVLSLEGLVPNKLAQPRLSIRGSITFEVSNKHCLEEAAAGHYKQLFEVPFKLQSERQLTSIAKVCEYCFLALNQSVDHRWHL